MSSAARTAPRHPAAEEEAPRPRGASRVLPPDDPSLDPRRPVRVARGVSALLVVLALVGSLQAVAMIALEARRLWTGERETTRLEAEVASLRSEAADLAEIAARGDDARFREHLARRQGYVYPDEVRYVISVPPGSEGPEPADPGASGAGPAGPRAP